MSDDQDKTNVDFRRGYTAGYQARCREEIESYFAQVRAGQQVYDRVLRKLIDVPTAAERKAARVATLREGHAAELHYAPVPDCPVCREAGAAAAEAHWRPMIEPYDAANQMAAWLARRGVGLTPTPGTVRRGVELDHAEALAQPECTHANECAPNLHGCVASQSQHNGHYGAPDQSVWWCRTHGRSYGECAGNTTDDSLCAAAPSALTRCAECGAPSWLCEHAGVREHRDTDYVVLAPCGADTPQGPCGLRAGHPVGPAYPGYDGHMGPGPAPCKRHAGEGNQINCTDCARRRAAAGL
jgi:hypothetical protein